MKALTVLIGPLWSCIACKRNAVELQQKWHKTKS